MIGEDIFDVRKKVQLEEMLNINNLNKFENDLIKYDENVVIDIMKFLILFLVFIVSGIKC